MTDIVGGVAVEVTADASSIPAEVTAAAQAAMEGLNAAMRAGLAEAAAQLDLFGANSTEALNLSGLTDAASKFGLFREQAQAALEPTTEEMTALGAAINVARDAAAAGYASVAAPALRCRAGGQRGRRPWGAGRHGRGVRRARRCGRPDSERHRRWRFQWNVRRAQVRSRRRGRLHDLDPDRRVRVRGQRRQDAALGRVRRGQGGGVGAGRGPGGGRGRRALRGAQGGQSVRQGPGHIHRHHRQCGAVTADHRQPPADGEIETGQSFENISRFSQQLLRRPVCRACRR